MEFKHVPIMLNECIEGLAVKENGIYLDGTLGGGGHSKEIVKRLVSGKLIATDLDTEAISAARENLKDYSDKFFPVNSNFKDFKQVAEELGIDGFDGILLDLGVSSYQLDNRERGFSYMASETELDMRMDSNQPFSAKNVVNEYSQEQLT